MAKTKSKDPAKIKRRVWELQSQCMHDGKEIWTPEIVTKVIEKLEEEKLDNGKPALKRWAWCMHDKDKVLEENIDQLRLKDPTSTLKIGDPRPAHIHLALEFENAVYNTHLQKISGLPIEFVRKPNAKYNQFMAMATYLSHCRAEEQAKGKHQYPVEEIHYKGFDYVEEVRKYLAVRDKNEAQVRKSFRFLADTTINRVERGELSVEDAKELIKETEGYAYFLRYEKEIRAARTEFVKRHYEMKPRINYYIYGAAGSGKSTISKYLAKALFPDLQDFECYYTVGAAGVRFDDYEYQPVIIWEDVRGEELLREYKREGLLNLMELSPKKRSYNIKYGKVTLTHQVNIFTGPVQFDEFIKVMMGSYSEGGQEIAEDKDKEQALRRFPVVINVKSHEVEVLRNSRIFDDSNETEFKRYARILNVSIAQLNEFYAGEALSQAFAVITEPMVKLHKEYMTMMSGDEKYIDRSFGPKRIEVIEGYEEVEDSIKSERETYHIRCKSILDRDKLSDGSRAPYLSHDAWILGDELDGEHERLFCPYTFEQWIAMGRPKDDMDNDYMDILYFSLDVDRDINLLYTTDQIPYEDENDFYEDLEFDENFNKRDIENQQHLVSHPKSDSEKRAPTPEELERERFVDSLEEQFMKAKTENNLRRWVRCCSAYFVLLPDYIEKSWYRVRSACIEAGIVSDETEWFRLYQRANCKAYNSQKLF